MGFFLSAVKQVFVVAMMLAMPRVWWLALGVERVADISTLDPGYFLMSLGGLVFLESLCYVMLPLDLIPDCIPILGKLDDGVAYILMFFAVVVAGLGVYINAMPHVLDFLS